MADVATEDPKRINTNLTSKCKLFFHKQQLLIILVITNKGTDLLVHLTQKLKNLPFIKQSPKSHKVAIQTFYFHAKNILYNISDLFSQKHGYYIISQIKMNLQ